MEKSRWYWIVKTGITSHWRLQGLSDGAFKMYFVMLDLAAELDRNGLLLSKNDHKLSRNFFRKRCFFGHKKTVKTIRELIDAGLIVEHEDGVLEVYNYAKFQKNLDTGAKRTARWRAKKRAESVTKCDVAKGVTETPHVTTNSNSNVTGGGGEFLKDSPSPPPPVTGENETPDETPEGGGEMTAFKPVRREEFPYMDEERFGKLVDMMAEYDRERTLDLDKSGRLFGSIIGMIRLGPEDMDAISAKLETVAEDNPVRGVAEKNMIKNAKLAKLGYRELG